MAKTALHEFFYTRIFVQENFNKNSQKNTQEIIQPLVNPAIRTAKPHVCCQLEKYEPKQTPKRPDVCEFRENLNRQACIVNIL